MGNSSQVKEQQDRGDTKVCAEFGEQWLRKGIHSWEGKKDYK